MISEIDTSTIAANRETKSASPPTKSASEIYRIKQLVRTRADSDVEMTAAYHRVLGAMLDLVHRNADDRRYGTIFAGREYIAKKAKVHPRTVDRAIVFFIGRGYLIRELPVGVRKAKGGRRKVNIYRPLAAAETSAETWAETSAETWAISPENLGSRVAETSAALPSNPLEGTQRESFSAPRRKTRLPFDFKVPPDWITEAKQARTDRGLPDVNLKIEAEDFVRHYAAKGDAFLDWEQNFIGWAVRAKPKPGVVDLAQYGDPRVQEELNDRIASGQWPDYLVPDIHPCITPEYKALWDSYDRETRANMIRLAKDLKNRKVSIRKPEPAGYSSGDFGGFF